MVFSERLEREKEGGREGDRMHSKLKHPKRVCGIGWFALSTEADDLRTERPGWNIVHISDRRPTYLGSGTVAVERAKKHIQRILQYYYYVCCQNKSTTRERGYIDLVEYPPTLSRLSYPQWWLRKILSLLLVHEMQCEVALPALPSAQ